MAFMHVGRSYRYSPLATSELNEAIEETLEDDDFAMPPVEDTSSDDRTSVLSSGGDSQSRIKKAAIFLLSNPAASVCILVLGVAGSLVPGLYAMFFLQPPPVLDKSVKAFDIPAHEVSLRDETLSLAIKNLYAYSRGKRDLERALHQTEFHESHNLLEEFVKVFMKRRSTVEEQLGALSTNFFSKRDIGLGQSESLEASQNMHVLKRRRRSPSLLISGDPNALTWKKWTMTLVYLASDEDDNNIFTSERLETIHKIEQSILNHAEFPKYCFKNYSAATFDRTLEKYQGCTPPNSLLTYFYPSQVDGHIYYDGLGSKQHNIDDALSLAMSKNSFYWYVDVGMNGTNRKSRLMRTEVYFGAPLPGFHYWHNNTSEQRDKFKKFIIELIKPLRKASTKKVRVLYGGNEIFDYEVESTFWNDIQLAIASFTVITLVMFVLTSCSVWLTFWGIFSILLCISLTLAIYRMVFGFNSLGILNGAAAFLIVGIGVDDVFVFINTFRQSSQHSPLADRMLHTLVTAGKATFFTSFTTAAAFAANLASGIPALHEFGAFMSLIVVCCWIMVVTLIPPALNLWHRWISQREVKCFKSCLKCQAPPSMPLPGDITHFLSSSHQSDMTGVNSSSQSDDDVPMFHLDEARQDDDVAMLVLEDEWRSVDQNVRRSEGCTLTSRIQAFMYYYIAVPVIKIRWLVLAAFLVLLAISVGLVTQLQPASRPPLLFKSGTNLQMFMDLKTNLSAEGISCDVCSGFFMEIPAASPSRPDDPRYHRPDHVQPSPTPSIHWPDWNLKPTSSGSNKNKKPAKTTSTPRTTTTVRRHSVKRPVYGTLPETSTLTHVVPSPVDPDLPLCEGDKCKKAASRPNLESSAMIYVVFGLKGVNNSNVSHDHVFSSSGSLIYNKEFGKNLDLAKNRVNGEMVRDLCRVCKLIGNNTDLVKPGSAQCLPFDPRNPYLSTTESIILGYMSLYSECAHLPGIQRSVDGFTALPDRALAEIIRGQVIWMAFAYESTTDQGQSYFTAYQQYLKWEKFIDSIKKNISQDSPLQDMFQTSHFWRLVMMEVVAVSSAVYGLVLSMVICVAAVAVFTSHVKLLIITCVTILGEICMVVALFFVAGWELGAVEAVSLSILVGTSVDYCVHLVEAYILAGKRPPPEVEQSESSLRHWRTSAAVSHIGVSILSSALTTVLASIPLTQTIIQPFAKFGQIVAINITVSIVYTLTVCIALLALMAPARFKSNWKATAKSLCATIVTIGVMALILFIVNKTGVVIPGPDGNSLFPQ